MAARRKNIKVALERVSRTDLLCVACGNFRTEWAIVPGELGVEEAVAGVHTTCIEKLRVRHARKKSTVLVDVLKEG